MKHKKHFGKLLLAGLASSLVLSISNVQGATLDSLNRQEEQQQNHISELEATISEKLSSINLKYMEIEDLQAQISATEASKMQTAEAIREQKEVITSRKEQLESRLVALQTSNATTNRILLLVESEDFSDFINRAYIVGQLQSADNEHFEVAIAEQKKLEELEQKLADEIESVKVAEARIGEESVALAADMSSLKGTLSENKMTLSQLLTDVSNEETRLAAEAEAAAAQQAESEKAAAESAQTIQTAPEPVPVTPAVAPAPAESSSQEAAPSASVQESVSRITDSSTASVAPSQPVVAEPVAAQTQMKTLVVSATAYSRHEAGLSDYTATGINLAVNPMVIAVDPSVIPLGSLVSVPGYGVAIAGDTGGAIIGNKIDLHMEDLAACQAFGRQSLTITILE